MTFFCVVIDTKSNPNQRYRLNVNVSNVAKVNVSTTNLIGLLSGFFISASK